MLTWLLMMMMAVQKKCPAMAKALYRCSAFIRRASCIMPRTSIPYTTFVKPNTLTLYCHGLFILSHSKITFFDETRQAYVMEEDVCPIWDDGDKFCTKCCSVFPAYSKGTCRNHNVPPNKVFNGYLTAISRLFNGFLTPVAATPCCSHCRAHTLSLSHVALFRVIFCGFTPPYSLFLVVFSRI